MQEKEKLDSFMSDFSKKVDTLSPLSEPEAIKLENELKGMDPEQVNAYLESMFNMVQKPYTRKIPKFGRNEPCFCGSGKKYKKCCQSEFEGYVNNLSDDEFNKITEDNEQDNSDNRE